MNDANNKTTKGSFLETILWILPGFSFVFSVIAIFISIHGNKISDQANQIEQAIRNESLDSRNIADYHRYEDLFWSNDPVNEARAVSFFRPDGNFEYQYKNLYLAFIEAQNSLNLNQKGRLQKDLVSIFKAANFDSIKNMKSK